MMTEREKSLFMALVEIAGELGWSVAIPEDQNSDNPDDVKGLILGELDYLEFVLENIPGGGSIASEIPQ